MEQLPMADVRDDAYRQAIETIRRLKVSGAAAQLHVEHGFTRGESCGDCERYRYLAVHGGYYVCGLAKNWKKWEPSTPACGKFARRTGRMNSF